MNSPLELNSRAEAHRRLLGISEAELHRDAARLGFAILYTEDHEEAVRRHLALEMLSRLWPHPKDDLLELCLAPLPPDTPPEHRYCEAFGRGFVTVAHRLIDLADFARPSEGNLVLRFGGEWLEAAR